MVLRVVARKVRSSTFYFLVIQAQTCSQDFNTTRPFPILWEQRRQKDIILFPAGEKTSSESNYSHKMV